MPSYIELDKQGSFAPSSDASKVILGINNDNLLQLTNSSGQSMSVAGLPYQVYTALVTQSGGDEYLYINSGDLTIGITYTIKDNEGSSGWDFTNVGALNNDLDTSFVATGTTPASWTNGTLQYNTGAPVVKVLENTIGNIWWTWASDGDYRATSNALFTLNKTYTSVSRNGSLGDNITFSSGVIDISSIYLYSGIGGDTLYPDLLNNTPIEIRVYN